MPRSQKRANRIDTQENRNLLLIQKAQVEQEKERAWGQVVAKAGQLLGKDVAEAIPVLYRWTEFLQVSPTLMFSYFIRAYFVEKST